MRFLAEYLRNLQVVSLQIELETAEKVVIRPASAQALANLDTSNLNVLEVYNCKSASRELIQLPVAVDFAPQELDGQKFRLRLRVTQEYPFTSPVKTPPFTIPRFTDGEPLIEPRAAVVWKPLPSEHWAELMDAWHCHKPQHEAQKELDKSLYGLAMNGFHAQPGLAYYSETYYLVHRDDLSVSGKLLVTSPSQSSIKIWRWDLGIPIANVIRTMLREKIDAHAVYTIVINKYLAIWVLNSKTECTYTKTATQSDVMKVLYTDIRKAPSVLDQRPDPEPIEIPEVTAISLLTQLAAVNAELPAAARHMNGWNVSII